MKSLSKIKFLTVCIILLITYTHTPSNAQYAGCLPCDQPTMRYVTKWNFVLPQFPTCTLTVSYWDMMCPPSTEHYYVDLHWSLYGGDCQTLVNYFVKHNPDGTVWIDWDAFNGILLMVYDEVALQDFEALDPNLYRCPNTYQAARFTNSYCSAFIIVLYQLTTGGFGIRCWDRQPCAQTGCCVYSNIYCYDNQNNIVVTHNDYYTGTCPQQQPPQFLCQPQPGDLFFTSGCYPWCQPRP